jgi:hypothetical protein
MYSRLFPLASNSGPLGLPFRGDFFGDLFSEVFSMRPEDTGLGRLVLPRS